MVQDPGCREVRVQARHREPPARLQGGPVRLDGHHRLAQVLQQRLLVGEPGRRIGHDRPPPFARVLVVLHLVLRQRGRDPLHQLVLVEVVVPEPQLGRVQLVQLVLVHRLAARREVQLGLRRLGGGAGAGRRTGPGLEDRGGEVLAVPSQDAVGQRPHLAAAPDQPAAEPADPAPQPQRLEGLPLLRGQRALAHPADREQRARVRPRQRRQPLGLEVPVHGGDGRLHGRDHRRPGVLPSRSMARRSSGARSEYSIRTSTRPPAAVEGAPPPRRRPRQGRGRPAGPPRR